MNDMTMDGLAAASQSSDLIGRIEAEHAAVGQALRSALAHPIAAGELLSMAKRQVRKDKGKWLAWLAANCTVPARTASHYMKTGRAAGQTQLRKRQRVADLSAGGHRPHQAPARSRWDKRFGRFGRKLRWLGAAVLGRAVRRGPSRRHAANQAQSASAALRRQGGAGWQDARSDRCRAARRYHVAHPLRRGARRP